jgi:Cof subfamily protein (haloacid dehalogenase superfamily)
MNATDMATIKLIAIDLDGTTLKHTPDDNFVFSPRVVATVKAAMQKGVRVCIATGRSVVNTRNFAQALAVNAPCILQQGGIIHDYATETNLFSLKLNRELACELAELERQHPSWHAVVYRGDHVYITGKRYPDSFYSLVGNDSIIEPDLCNALRTFDPEKVLFVLPEEETRAVLKVVSEFVGPRANVVQSHKLFVEVNPLGADKGAGLMRLAAHLGIYQDEVMAIGDEGNDATMIAWAGLGVVMANGNPITQANADWIAPTIDEDGAAVAIEKFVLGE